MSHNPQKIDLIVSSVFKKEADKPQSEKSAISKKSIVAPSFAKSSSFERPKNAEKVLKSILKKAGVDELPALEHLLRNKNGIMVKKISDVAVFVGSPENDVLAWLSEILPHKNVINGSAEVDLRNVVNVGTEIVKSGKLYQIPHIAEIGDDNVFQCTSGRHRLAFLALAYGPDAVIPFYSEKMSMNEARDAVVYANDARNVGAREKAEHSAMVAANGDSGISQDELYAKMCFNRSEAKQYCLYSVVNRSYPIGLSFEVSTSSSKGSSLATIGSVSGYWKIAVPWSQGMSRMEFDQKLLNATKFLNEIVDEMKTLGGFDCDQHLAAMPLIAIGKYYRTITDIGMSVDHLVVEKLAAVVVGMGSIARVSTDNIYSAILSKMRAG